MANKRMFSLSVVDTDSFLEMPISSRLLYYELGMRADDDGFVDNWKKILLFTGLKEDDMKLLIAKNFIIPFESGVIVIRHWRLNNYLQNDRIKPTIYQEELKQLGLDKNNVYNFIDNGEFLPIENKEKRELKDYEIKRKEAKQNSDLPYSFDYKIRNAFVGEKCPICGKVMNYGTEVSKPTIQHNKPISKGGKHEIDNISVICSSCNLSIQNKEETPPYNTEKVKEIWENLANVYKNTSDCIHSIDKYSIDKYSIEENSSSIYNIYDFIEQNFARTLSPIEYDEIKSWEDNELTRYAIKQAVLNGKYNIHYISVVLNNYKKNSITTVQQAQQEEQKFREKKEKKINGRYQSTDEFNEILDNLVKRGD